MPKLLVVDDDPDMLDLCVLPWKGMDIRLTRRQMPLLYSLPDAGCTTFCCSM